MNLQLPDNHLSIVPDGGRDVRVTVRHPVHAAARRLRAGLAAHHRYSAGGLRVRNRRVAHTVRYYV